MNHKHPICEVCKIEINVGDPVYECENPDCGCIVHQNCYVRKNEGS